MLWSCRLEDVKYLTRVTLSLWNLGIVFFFIPSLYYTPPPSYFRLPVILRWGTRLAFSIHKTLLRYYAMYGIDPYKAFLYSMLQVSNKQSFHPQVFFRAQLCEHCYLTRARGATRFLIKAKLFYTPTPPYAWTRRNSLTIPYLLGLITCFVAFD